MNKVYAVVCDFGLFPGYITILIYFIIAILVHHFMINSIIRNKNKINNRVAKYLTKLLGRKIDHISVKKILPVIIISITFLLMFMLYPALTNRYCPHLFWRLFGINTL